MHEVRHASPGAGPPYPSVMSGPPSQPSPSPPSRAAARNSPLPSSRPSSGTGPVFIVGADRSGTTLLRLFLDAHRDLSIPAESWFLPALIEHFPSERPLSVPQQGAALACVMAHRRWQEGWRSTPADYRALLSDGRQRTLAELVDAMYRTETARTGATRWGDKTPEYVMHVEPLAALFPDARFVHIVRDGRDVCQSLLRKRWSDRGVTPFQVARYWDRAVHAGHDAAERLGPDRMHLVTYEELVLATERTLRRVCDFLGLPFDPPMLQAHEHAADIITEPEAVHHIHPKLSRRPQPSDVGRWRREGSRTALALCWSWLVWGLERYGYDRPRPPAPLLPLRLASWLAYEGTVVGARSKRFRRRLANHMASALRPH